MRISLIVPVYNEEEAVPIFYKTVRTHRCMQGYEAEIVFVNDGSHDATAEILARIAAQDDNVIVLNFRRNFGKEVALWAGLKYAAGTAIIPIDVDLQDPITLVLQLIAKWQSSGADVVLAKRVDRSSDSLLKKTSACWFYKIFNKLASEKIEENVGDFRLLSHASVQQLLKLTERNLFMKGLFSWIGGKVEVVEYARAQRIHGKSKFSAWKLWNLAIEGITSFSTLPLRLWTYVGLAISGLSFVYAIIKIISKMVWGNSVAGYTSLLVCILFLGGIQLIGIGILGEYVGRIYMETKQRPLYLLKSVINKK